MGVTGNGGTGRSEVGPGEVDSRFSERAAKTRGKAQSIEELYWSCLHCCSLSHGGLAGVIAGVLLAEGV